MSGKSTTASFDSNGKVVGTSFHLPSLDFGNKYEGSEVQKEAELLQSLSQRKDCKNMMADSVQRCSSTTFEYIPVQTYIKPVKTILTPALLAALITSLSRIDPPG